MTSIKHLTAALLSIIPLSVLTMAGCSVEPIEDGDDTVVEDNAGALVSHACSGTDYSSTTTPKKTFSTTYYDPDSTNGWPAMPGIPTGTNTSVGAAVNTSQQCVAKINALRTAAGLPANWSANIANSAAMNCCTANDAKKGAATGHYNTCGFDGYASWAQGISQTIPYAVGATGAPSPQTSTNTMVQGLWNEYPGGHGDIMRGTGAKYVKCGAVQRRFADGTWRAYLTVNYWNN